MADSELLNAALEYARRGWYVFPCECAQLGNKETGKRPNGRLVPNGKNDSSLDESLIRHWWAQGEWNIGIDTARSGLVVLDVDIANGKKGRESLAKIDSQLIDTLTAQTGSNGIHAVYQRPTDFIPTQRLGFDEGLDLISNGYIIAAPSKHYSGGTYRWANSNPITVLPEVLRNVQKAAKPHVALGDVGAPIVEGGRNNALFKVGAALRNTGIGHDALRAALHMENRTRFVPPLEDEEVDAIAISVMTRVKPERDVAAGAIVADELAQLFGPAPENEPIAMMIRDVAMKPRTPMRFYSTGNPQLDALLGGGIASTHVCGVMGPPSVGKSAFVGSMCIDLQAPKASGLFAPVLHVSTELTRYELMIRYAANRKGFPWRDAMKGMHDAALLEATSDLNIVLMGCDNLDRANPIGCIAEQAMAVREAQGVSPIIVIDYVQLLARGGDDGMRNRVGELTMKIRILAQLMDCPIIAVFSTGRAFYNSANLEKLRQANDPTAYLGAAKESGDIEFDCATLLFLDVHQLAEGPIKPARAVVARCRVGDIGFAGYRANLAVGRWSPDPLAASEVAGAVGSSKAEAKLEQDIKAFVETVGQHPGLPWGALRDKLGLLHKIGHTRADMLLKELTVNGGPILRVDTLNDKMRPIVTLKLKGPHNGNV